MASSPVHEKKQEKEKKKKRGEIWGVAICYMASCLVWEKNLEKKEEKKKVEERKSGIVPFVIWLAACREKKRKGKRKKK